MKFGVLPSVSSAKYRSKNSNILGFCSSSKLHARLQREARNQTLEGFYLVSIKPASSATESSKKLTFLSFDLESLKQASSTTKSSN